jgi:hypothetical protein
VGRDREPDRWFGRVVEDTPVRPERPEPIRNPAAQAATRPARPPVPEESNLVLQQEPGDWPYDGEFDGPDADVVCKECGLKGGHKWCCAVGVDEAARFVGNPKRQQLINRLRAEDGKPAKTVVEDCLKAAEEYETAAALPGLGQTFDLANGAEHWKKVAAKVQELERQGYWWRVGDGRKA